MFTPYESVNNESTTQSQSNWLMMFCAVQRYCQNQRPVVEKNPALATGINSLGQLIAAIRCMSGLLSESRTHPQQGERLRDVIYTFSRIQTGLALAYAIEQGNRDLEMQLRFSREDLRTMTDEEVKRRLQLHYEMVLLLSPRLAVYGNNASALKAWELVLINYMPVLDSPKTAIMRRKEINLCFNQLFKDALSLCSEFLDPLAEDFKKKYPEFHAGYQENRKTEHPGDSGIRIRGSVRTGDSGAQRKASRPLSDAFITIVETGVVVKTDAEGLFSFRSVKKGSYTLRAEKTGYYTKTSTRMNLKDGEHAEIEFELVFSEQLQD
jgi:hypothetical protein